MTIKCNACDGHGKTVEVGFDGRTAVKCQPCRGTGEIVLTPEETVLMRSFLAECALMFEAHETSADIETFLVASSTFLVVA